METSRADAAAATWIFRGHDRYDDDGFSRDDCIGTITVPLYKLKDGKRKHYEKTIDMNWMGMVKGGDAVWKSHFALPSKLGAGVEPTVVYRAGATLHFELEAQGWGCVE